MGTFRQNPLLRIARSPFIAGSSRSHQHRRKPPPPPTPPPPADNPLTDRAKGFTKGIAYLIASSTGLLILIYGVDANMHKGKGAAYFAAAIFCIRGIIKGLAYILRGNQKVQEEEEKAQQQAEGGCSRAFIITIVIIFILALACCLFVSLFGD